MNYIKLAKLMPLSNMILITLIKGVLETIIRQPRSFSLCNPQVISNRYDCKHCNLFVK